MRHSAPKVYSHQETAHFLYGRDVRNNPKAQGEKEFTAAYEAQFFSKFTKHLENSTATNESLDEAFR